MITRLRALWHDINASYWFFPGLFAFGALILALVTLWLDRADLTDWLDDIELIQEARPQGASNMLTVIAGSMIGVAATVFSITIAAVAYASGNYGPRLLNNFMEDRGNQLSLGSFIGTFVYALTVLREVRKPDEAAPLIPGEDVLAGYVPQLSLLVAYLLMGVSIVVLIYFLNHIPASIRINSVLKGIGERLLLGIDKYYPEKNAGEPAPERPEGVPVHADKAGYVQVMDVERLHELAETCGGRIVLSVRPGDFVHAGMELTHWCVDESAAKTDPPTAQIRSCFAVGAQRSPHQDLRFLIDELVEIGMRALSPGINDPFTAITALHWLSAATARLGERELSLKFGSDGEADGSLVVPLPDDFGQFLARGFGSLRGAVATSRLAAMVMFEALRDAAVTLDDEARRALLRREGTLLMSQVRKHLDGPELDMVEARFADFTIRTL
jgi:uncharacterized membrane protein